MDHTTHDIPHANEQVTQKNSHPIHGSAMISDYKRRFRITIVITIPILLLSPTIQLWLGIDTIFSGQEYILLLLASIVYFYGGYPFLKGLWSEMRAINPGMMTLIGFAITVAYTYSVATIFLVQGMDFFWELATLIAIMLLGHWIEMKSIAGASRELELLVQLLPADAHKIVGETIQEVSTDSLQPDDVIMIKSGEKIAADGIIINGESYINESMVTGESTPVHRILGDKVIAGSINGNGVIRIKVTHSSKESYLSQVIDLVKKAQQSKSQTQLLADKAARWLTVIALVAGLITFFYWIYAGQPFVFALERMVTVIIISCPHALGLAVPLVVAKSTSLAAKHGLLIKNRTAFENSRKITSIVFDKTGTLTVGTFAVTRFDSIDKSYIANDILRYGGAIEQGSEHPIATGIVAKVQELGLSPFTANNVVSVTGEGIYGVIDGKKVGVVSPRVINKEKIVENKGSETIVYITIDNNPIGYIALADQIRPESYDAIKTLREHHINTILITGDNKEVAASVSKELGIDDYRAEVLPDQKLGKIKELQGYGEFVAMTGDGVNDAPALAQADIGIAVGSGSDIAAETAGIILVNSNPKDIVNLILFGKATHKKMIQNLIWATGYNLIAIPLAAGVLYNYGILLTPAIGAVLMSLSTIVVAINASLLRITKE